MARGDVHGMEDGQTAALKTHTLVIMVLVRVIAVELAQQFDHICIGIRAGELVSRAIKAENELLRLSGIIRFASRRRPADRAERRIGLHIGSQWTKEGKGYLGRGRGEFNSQWLQRGIEGQSTAHACLKRAFESQRVGGGAEFVGRGSPFLSSSWGAVAG